MFNRNDVRMECKIFLLCQMKLFLYGGISKARLKKGLKFF